MHNKISAPKILNSKIFKLAPTARMIIWQFYFMNSCVPLPFSYWTRFSTQALWLMLLFQHYRSTMLVSQSLVSLPNNVTCVITSHTLGGDTLFSIFCVPPNMALLLIFTFSLYSMSKIARQKYISGLIKETNKVNVRYLSFSTLVACSETLILFYCCCCWIDWNMIKWK